MKWGSTCPCTLTAGWGGDGVFLGIAAQEGSELLGGSLRPLQTRTGHS